MEMKEVGTRGRRAEGGHRLGPGRQERSEFGWSSEGSIWEQGHISAQPPSPNFSCQEM